MFVVLPAIEIYKERTVCLENHNVRFYNIPSRAVAGGWCRMAFLQVSFEMSSGLLGFLGPEEYKSIRMCNKALAAIFNDAEISRMWVDMTERARLYACAQLLSCESLYAWYKYICLIELSMQRTYQQLRQAGTFQALRIIPSSSYLQCALYAVIVPS